MQLEEPPAPYAFDARKAQVAQCTQDRLALRVQHLAPGRGTRLRLWFPAAPG